MPRPEVLPRAPLEEGELRAISEAHRRPLLGYLQRLTGDLHLAEDIVQETFFRAWREAPSRGSRNGGLRPWLFRVARNLATDLHRARRARPREVSVEPAFQLPAADRADRSVQVSQIVGGLHALRREHRVVIVEVCLRGRSVAEAAGVLGIPAGTVKSRCYYGLRALRAELDRRGLLR
jgi:RNA polymerase sigma-70 factor (ECF subfamily)